MNIKSLSLGLVLYMLPISMFAGGYYPSATSQDQPWSISASIGDGRFTQIPSNQTHTLLGRLALANEMVLSGDVALGLELGLQNNHKLYLNKVYTLENAHLRHYTLPSVLSPLLDLLITAKTDPLGQSSLFAQFKGGVAYRRWRLHSKSIQDLSQLAGEIQAGFGYPVSALSNLNLLYQGIFGGDPNFQFDAYSGLAHITNIPALHAVLIGLSFNL